MKLMFNNSDNVSGIEVGFTHSGRPFREFPLANLFNKNYEDGGFYSREEAELIDEEYSESAKIGEI